MIARSCEARTAAAIEFDVPALRIQRAEIVLAHLPLIDQRGDQHLMVDPGFAHRQLIRETLVLRGRYPFWACRRFGLRKDGLGAS